MQTTKMLLLVLSIISLSLFVYSAEARSFGGLGFDFESHIDGKIYKSTGRFRNGLGKGIHRQFSDKKLVRKEKYKDGICHTTYYYENGKIMTEGNTKMVLTENEIHWFYNGDWKFYDESGQLIGTRTYENGAILNETEIK